MSVDQIDLDQLVPPEHKPLLFAGLNTLVRGNAEPLRALLEQHGGYPNLWREAAGYIIGKEPSEVTQHEYKVVKHFTYLALYTHLQENPMENLRAFVRHALKID